MTALSLALPLLNRSFANDFNRDLWMKDFEGVQTPAMNISSQVQFDEATSTWKITMEVAGVTKENLKVDAKDELLSVSGEKTKGFDLGKFEKHFKLPEGVDLEKIEAQFEDGILTVQLPLVAKKAPKTIQIK